MKKTLYTYEQWWNGEFALSDSQVYSKDNDNILKVDWKDIRKNDVPKIIERRKEMFLGLVNKMLEHAKNDFTKRYERSELKEKLVENERKNIESILFGKYPKNIKSLKHKLTGYRFDANSLHLIQAYANNIILQGKEDRYSNIHSPNFPHQKKHEYTKHPQCYARFLWEYFKWLKNYEKKVVKWNKEINSNWFKVGLMFANGEMDKLIEKHNKDGIPIFRNIAREIDKKNVNGYNNYIRESYNAEVKTTNSKNIFSFKDKVDKIQKHCKLEKIPIVNSFYILLDKTEKEKLRQGYGNTFE